MNGFKGKLYNAQGVVDWLEAGYELTMDPASVTPPCTQQGGNGSCRDGAKAVMAGAAKPIVTRRNPSCNAVVKINGERITDNVINGNNNVAVPKPQPQPQPNPPSPPANNKPPAPAPATPAVSPPSQQQQEQQKVDATYNKDGTVTIRVRKGGGRRT